MLINSTQTTAQQRRSPSNNTNQVGVRFVSPTLEKEPENRGAPDERVGAGTRRGDCPAIPVNKPHLTSLVPLMQRTLTQKQQGTTSKFVLGLTVAEYPTFWFYVPYAPKDVRAVKFMLLDENNNSVTKEPIPITLSGTPGVISFSFPQKEKPLLVGKYYHWYLLIDCNPASRSADINIQGLVQRVEPNSDLMRRLETATPQERIALYARSGIWHEAIALLGELRRTKPQDAALASDWVNLLRSVELENIATEPIVPCCKP
ncbi:DUF928 domain-containing protein [Scytonema sp. NUACC26]|uniref:DUF928 domain-containing protein n=1 Tax=Scytonema sp. NUACC26 TaxID=3140176 RepID=UPI0038B24512